MSILTFLLASVVALAAPDKDIVRQVYCQPGVPASFKVGADWFPYPEYSDREAWSRIFGPDSARYVQRAEKLLDYEWKHIPATAYLAFERTGDRRAMEVLEGNNRSAFLTFMLAELAEGKGRFLDQIANALFNAVERRSWVLSAHTIRQTSGRSIPEEKFIDLASGRYGAMVSLACHFFRKEMDALDPSICRMARAAVKEHILDSFLDPGAVDMNWWTGFSEAFRQHGLNNWNPWCGSDTILCFLLMEDDQVRLNRAMNLSVSAIDNFLNYITEDGACEEGPAYWYGAAGKLYDYLQILYDASGGKFNLFTNDRIRRMGEYISRQYIGDGYITNFADGAARGGNTPGVVWPYGYMTGSREMMDFAIYLLADPKNGRFRYPEAVINEGYRAINSTFMNEKFRAQIDSVNALVAATSFDAVLKGLRADVPVSSWYPQTEVCFLRNSCGWFLGAKGGYNDESHNHNDIGSCILYVRETPVLIDAGVGTYTRQTFNSKERYHIWSMQCDWHNLPMPNGAAQQHGRDYRAVDVACDVDRRVFSLDLRDAYPEEASVSRYVRSYSLGDGKKTSLVISDSFRLNERKASDVLHFLVKGEVTLDGPGVLHIACDNGLVMKMTYPRDLSASVDVKELEDPKFSHVWGPSIRRINLTGRPDAPLSGSFKLVLTEE